MVDRLSDRQVSCLRLVAELRKTEQIAAELGISPSSVNTYIERAMALLGVSSRREAARLVMARDAARLDACREERPTEKPRLPEPPPTPPVPTSPATAIGRRRNDLTWMQRLALAMFALMTLCIAIAGLGAAIEQLSQWRHSLAPGSPTRS